MTPDAAAATGLAVSGAYAILIGAPGHAAGSTLPDLPAVATTLDDLEAALRDVCGLAPERVVRVPADADTEQVIGTVERVARRATGTVLLYYVGHGLLGPGDELYLATRATRSPEQISHAVPYRTLQGLLGDCAGGGIVVLDCCYSGRAGIHTGSGGAHEPFVSARPDGSLLLSATSRYDLSFAPEGRRHTLFSGAVLRLLTEGDPAGPLWLTMDSLSTALDHTFADGPIRPRRQSEGSLGTMVIARNRAYRDGGPTDGGAAVRRDEPPADIPCPYPGTESFRTTDSRHYFGRDALVRRLLDAVSATGPDPVSSVTVLIGASGVGKSSLLRAGLLAGLERRHLSAADPHVLPWPALLLPGPGTEPLRALAELWARATGRTAADVHRRLLRGGRLPGPLPGRTPCALLVVDQFEEVFTRCPDPVERARFIDALLPAAERAGVRPGDPATTTGGAPDDEAGPPDAPGPRVVLGLRADHYGSCLAHPPLVPVLERRQLMVPPMSDGELRAAIEGPARVAGLGLEAGLTERLLQDLRWGHVRTEDTGPGASATGSEPPADTAPGTSATGSEPPANTAPGTSATGSGPPADTTPATPATGSEPPADTGPAASVTGSEKPADPAPPLDHAAPPVARPRDLSGPDLDIALPFLAHALRETWRRRSGTTLTLAGYQATGGIWHSISTTTERLYQELDPAGREVLRELLLRMVHVTTDGGDALVRRKVASDALLDGFPPPQRHVVAALRDRLAEARLITVDQDGAQLSHESLLRSWPRLRRWIDEDRSGLITRQRLSEAARAWHAAGRDPGFHYRGSLLEATRRLMPEERLRHRRLPRLDEEFLAASVAADRAERAREARRTLRLKQALGAVAVALVLALVGGALALEQQGVAQAERTSATHRALVAEATARRAAQPRLALKLAMAAHALRPTAETRAAVSDTLVHSRLVGSSAHDEREPLLSPDGRSQVGEADGERLVLRLTGRRSAGSPAAFAPCAEGLNQYAFDRAGRTLAVSCDDGAVTLWDVTAPARPRRTGALKSPELRGRPQKVGFRLDGAMLAVGWSAPEGVPATRGALVLWDVRDHARPVQLALHENVYDNSAMHFGPDGRTLLSSTGLVTARDEAVNSDSITHTSGATLWDVSRPTAPRPLARIPRVDELAALGGDGRSLITTDGATVQIWDVRNAKAPRKQASWTAHRDQVTAVAISPDGRTLATGGLDDTIALWDMTDPAHPVESARLNGHSAIIASLVFAADGRRMVSTDSEEVIHWDLDGGAQPRPVAVLGARAALTSVAFTPDGRTLATAGYDQSVTLYDVSTPARPRRTAEVPTPAFVTDIAVSRDGGLLAAGDRLGNVLLWDIRDRTRPRKIAQFSYNTDPITSVDFAPHGRGVIVSGAQTFFSPGWAVGWDITDPSRPRGLGTYAEDISALEGVRYSPDGKLVTLPALRTHLLPVGASAQAVELAESNAASAFAPDGKALVTGGSGRDAILWDITDPRRPRRTTEIDEDRGGAGPYTYAYHPAGDLVAGLAQDDGSVVLWSVADRERAHRAAALSRHSSPVDDLAFRPDGRYAATVSGGDDALVIWDLNRLPSVSADLIGTACAMAEGGLTRGEWRAHVPGRPYRDTCEGRAED
ncbi:caspase family protein [Streptomyces californicus]|uniref:caspase, EACC1-associated type n=1 Tax=Streptomyces californicus TaxID=67351 RepID=UPI0037B3D21E